jgi:lipid-binding SYLF domain-containing protein
MGKMRSTAVLAAAVLVISHSAALAKEEPVKAGAESKAVKGAAAKPGTAPKAVKNDATTIAAATKVIKEIHAASKVKIPPALLKDASAIVIIPKAAKVSFMVRDGKAGGVLLARDNEKKWSSPVFVTLSGGTLGWQIVSDPMDIVLVFRDQKNVDAILKGELILNTKVSVMPGWLGPTMKGADAKVKSAQVASYVRSHGEFMEEAALGGSAVLVDARANDAYYVSPKVIAADIVSGKVAKASDEVKALQKQLADYVGAK